MNGTLSVGPGIKNNTSTFCVRIKNPKTEYMTSALRISGSIERRTRIREIIAIKHLCI